MKKHKHGLAVITIAAFFFGALVPAVWASDEHKGEKEDEDSESKTLPFKDARLKIELNATDGDAGIQMFVDSDPWKSIDIFDPSGKRILRSTTQGSFAKQGGNEFFMESAEPNFGQLPLKGFLKRFREGDYGFKGEGVNGEFFFGTAKLTHNLPEGPRLISPIEGDGLTDPDNTVVTWELVEAPNGSPIIAYQVLVVQADSPYASLPKIALDIIMPPTATSMRVPPGFLLPATEYEWEVLAIEESGNQTLSSSFLTTMP